MPIDEILQDELEKEITIVPYAKGIKICGTCFQSLDIGKELEYLRWFYQNLDIGPATDDIINMYQEQYVDITGNPIPEGY